MKKIQQEKKQIVNELTGGIQTLFRANGITSIAGRALLQG